MHIWLRMSVRLAFVTVGSLPLLLAAAAMAQRTGP